VQLGRRRLICCWKPVDCTLKLVAGGDIEFSERAEGRRGSLVPPVIPVIGRRGFTRIAAQLERGAVAAQQYWLGDSGSQVGQQRVAHSWCCVVFVDHKRAKTTDSLVFLDPAKLHVHTHPTNGFSVDEDYLVCMLTRSPEHTRSRRYLSAEEQIRDCRDRCHLFWCIT
jgi:hypothetical protein